MFFGLTYAYEDGDNATHLFHSREAIEKEIQAFVSDFSVKKTVIINKNERHFTIPVDGGGEETVKCIISEWVDSEDG